MLLDRWQMLPCERRERGKSGMVCREMWQGRLREQRSYIRQQISAIGGV
jgi:hypothetical protein